MNEIIRKLELALEKAEHECPWPGSRPYDPQRMTYRAVYCMGLDLLEGTLDVFKHARKLKNELEARRKPKKDDAAHD